MGRAERLKKLGILKLEREWFVGIKRDLSYEIKEQYSREKEVVRRVERIVIIPLTTGTGFALTGRTKLGAEEEINDLIDAMPDEVRCNKDNNLFKVDVYAFELRNSLGQPRDVYDGEWYKTHVLSEEKITLLPRKVGRLL